MFLQTIKDFFKRIFNHPLIKSPLIALAIVALAVALFFAFLHIFTRHGRGFPIPDFSCMTVQDAKKKAADLDLRFEITDSVYIMSKDPGTVIDQNPTPGTFVKANRRVLVTSNAVNPLLVEMPNLVGLTLRQAKSTLNLQGFKLGYLSFVPDIAVNNVLEQHFKGKQIEPGEEIPKGSEINLVLGKGLYNEKTVLPRVIGLTLSEARNLLQDASLNLGRFTFDETIIDNVDSLQAQVYNQYPNINWEIETFVNFGGRVDIWLTQNESRIPPEPKPEVEEADSTFKYLEPEEEILE